jgi:hypothetical protein
MSTSSSQQPKTEKNLPLRDVRCVDEMRYPVYSNSSYSILSCLSVVRDNYCLGFWCVRILVYARLQSLASS